MSVIAILSIDTYTLSPANGIEFVRFEVFTAVTMKNVVFWDVSP
jgi:hypothetical protein